jgi:hypothetical protein
MRDRTDAELVREARHEPSAFGELNETWQSTSPPFRIRHIGTVAGGRVEMELDGGRVLAYDRSTDTIYEDVLPGGKRVPLKDLRSGVLAQLESGDARIDGRERVDGRNAIRIVSDGGTYTYLVDATTYNPIEWRTTQDGVRTTFRFLVYEELPATAENGALLSLAAQHPTARVRPGRLPD